MLLGYFAATSNLQLDRPAEAALAKLQTSESVKIDRTPTAPNGSQDRVECSNGNLKGMLFAKTDDQKPETLLAQAGKAADQKSPSASSKKPNIVMLMTDDTGWNDFGCYGGGANLGHPTPNVDRVAKEGAVFTCWYGQASCTAGRASFMTGRIPIRSALSVVVAPGDENGLQKSTPTIAEFFQKNGYNDLFLRQVASGRSTQILPD